MASTAGLTGQRTQQFEMMSVAELTEAIRRIGDELSQRSDPDAYPALVDSTVALSLALGKGWPRPLMNYGIAPGKPPHAWSVASPEATDWATNDWTTDWAATDWAATDWTATDWSTVGNQWWTPSTPAPTSATTATRQWPITMFGISEPTPGPRWRALFEATWPAYRAWFLSDGDAARADLATSRAMLQEHMPELVPTWEALVELTGGDEMAARMLTLWEPPRFLPGCSQAVLTGDRPVLVRNYDYSPDLFERVSYSSAFTGRRVIGTGDCLWGLLDGMNEDGLVVSLTFGGRPGSGHGFAIPLVVRYLLETATTVDDACAILERLPVSMSYNLTMTDASGATCTAYVSPGRDPEFSTAAVATNHRGETPEYPAHAHSLRSVERQREMQGLLAQGIDRDDLVARFLEPPLHSSAYSRSFGTLYTAVYRPDEGSLTYVWPDTTWERTFDSPDETKDLVLQGA